MNALTTIKHSTSGFNIYAGSGDELIATAVKTNKTDSDAANGKYRICIYGGIAHGKFSYAQNMQDLNDKSVEILRLRA